MFIHTPFQLTYKHTFSNAKQSDFVNAQDAEYTLMELELSNKLLDLLGMSADMRQYRSMKLVEKVNKCLEKIQKYRQEMEEYAGMQTQPAAAC